jgi:4-aminobutyrate aminotransferase-like enzyme
MPAHLNACIFVNSGSEANDVAWRIAQMATGHRGGLVMDNAYHGITDAVAALTPGVGRPRDPRVVTIAPPVDGPAQVTEAVRDTDAAIALLAERGLAPAAFFIDTAITSSGIFDPPAAWAVGLSARMRAAGSLIVADEVQYGLGRSGSHLWGCERRGLEPDIVTLGKPMGNGLPIAGLVARRDIMDDFGGSARYFNTFGGNPVCVAAAAAVLDVLDAEALPANAAATGAYLNDELSRIALGSAVLGDVRGAGLYLGVDVITPAGGEPSPELASAIVNGMRRRRVLISATGPHGNVLKVRPPLPFLAEHADQFLAAFTDVLAATEQGGEFLRTALWEK